MCRRERVDGESGERWGKPPPPVMVNVVDASDENRVLEWGWWAQPTLQLGSGMQRCKRS